MEAPVPPVWAMVMAIFPSSILPTASASRILLSIIFIFCNYSFSKDPIIPKNTVSQGEVVDLAIKITGLDFFIPKRTETMDEKKIFELKKKIASMHYPALKKAEKNRPADCCFLGEVAYEIITPPEEREKISCEGVINSLQSKGYSLTCGPGEVVDKSTALNFFRDPKFLTDVMEKVETVKSSPYSTELSQSYSTPASKTK